MTLGVLIGVVLTVAVIGAWTTWRVWDSFRSVERIETDLDSARARLEGLSEAERPSPPLGDDPQDGSVPTTTAPEEPVTPEEGSSIELSEIIGQQLPYDPAFADSPDIADEVFDAYLIIGSDARAGLGGSRADVILLALLPTDGSDPILISLPRDLYLPNPCFDSPTRINAGLNGCGEHANGPELLALMIEDYTGIQPDHFALFDFEDFVRVIDAFGGITICVAHPMREGLFELPAGCSLVGGERTLTWVRSRHTQEYVDGRWRTMPGVSDLTRTERQQDLLIGMFAKLASFNTTRSLASVVEGLADALIIDEGITLGEAIGLAWEIRDVRPGDILRIRPPVKSHVTGGGASVLLPTQPFSELLAEVYSS